MSSKTLGKRKGGAFFSNKRSRAAFKAPRQTVKQLVAQALMQVVEKKWVDIAEAAYACDTTGTITALNLTAEAAGPSGRIGRKITMTAVQLAGTIQPFDNITQAAHCKVLLIYDKQPNGALPAMTDIFVASTSNSFMNLNNRDRFQVLAVHDVAIGTQDNTATQAFAGSPTVHVVKTYKTINLPTIYDGATAAIGDVQTGSLLLVTVGDRAAGLGGVFFGAVRTRYGDA